jgi:hypothetical protein
MSVNQEQRECGEQYSLQEILESITTRINSIECTLGYIIKSLDIKPPDAEAGIDSKESPEQV